MWRLRLIPFQFSCVMENRAIWLEGYNIVGGFQYGNDEERTAPWSAVKRHWTIARFTQSSRVTKDMIPMRQDRGGLQSPSVYGRKYGNHRYCKRVWRRVQKGGEDGLCLPVIGLYSKTAFQSMVERWCGTVDLVYALYDFPEVVEECLSVIQEKDMETVKNALKSSAEGFIFWEDSSTTNINPDMFEQYTAPEINQWGKMIHDSGKQRQLSARCIYWEIQSSGKISKRKIRRWSLISSAVLAGCDIMYFLEISGKIVYVVKYWRDGNICNAVCCMD